MSDVKEADCYCVVCASCGVIVSCLNCDPSVTAPHDEDLCTQEAP